MTSGSVDRPAAADPAVAFTPPRGRRRLLRIAAWGLGALVLAVGGTVAVVHVRAVRTIEAFRARFERERVPVETRDRGRPALLAADGSASAEDAADRFVAAIDRVPPRDRDALRAPEDVDDDSDEPPVDASPEHQDQVIAAHPEPIQALLAVLRAPSRPPPPIVDRVARPAELDPMVRRWRGTFWAEAVVRRYVAHDERGPALRVIAALIALGADLERTGGALPRLLGVTPMRAGLLRFADVSASGPLPVDAARELADVLDRLAAVRPSWFDDVDVERTTFFGLWTAHNLDGDAFVKTGWRHLWSLRVFRAAALEEGDAAWSRIAALEVGDDADLHAAHEAAIVITGGVENKLAGMHLITVPMVLRQALRLSTSWRLARTALALRLHVDVHGRLPDRLEALVPAFLPAVPRDPWTGRPLRYVAGPPARVWSVGPDRVDDEGKPSDDPDDAGSHGDEVVVVHRPR